jgi:hypothetical protein
MCSLQTYLIRYLHRSYTSHSSCLLNLREPTINGLVILPIQPGRRNFNHSPTSFTFHVLLEVGRCRINIAYLSYLPFLREPQRLFRLRLHYLFKSSLQSDIARMPRKVLLPFRYGFCREKVKNGVRPRLSVDPSDDQITMMK